MKKYVFGQDTLTFDSDEDAIAYAEETGANEFKPLDSIPQVSNVPQKVEQKTPGFLEATFPRSYTEPDSSSIPRKAYEGLKDVASIPGRALYSGLVAGLNTIGGEKDIGQKAISDFSMAEGDPTQGFLPNLAKDLLTNPLNLVPGVGTIGKYLGKGVGKIAPQVAERGLQIVSRLPSGPVSQAISHGVSEGGLNVGLGKLEGSENVAGDFATGMIGGAIPGAYRGMKSETKRQLGEDIFENVKREYPEIVPKDPKKLISTQRSKLYGPGNKFDEAQRLNDYLVSNGMSKKAPKDLEGKIRQYEIDVQTLRNLPAPKAEFVTGLGGSDVEFTVPKFQEAYPGTQRFEYLRNVSPEMHQYPKLQIQKPNIQGGAVPEIIGNLIGLAPGIPTLGKIISKPDIS